MRRTAHRRARACLTLTALLVAGPAATAGAAPFLVTTGASGGTPPTAVTPFDIGTGGSPAALGGPFAPVSALLPATPGSAAIGPDARSLYVVDGDTSTPLAVEPFDVAADGRTTAKSAAAPITSQFRADAVAVSPDGRVAVTIDFNGSRVVAFEIGAGGRLESAAVVPGVGAPNSVVFGADSRSLYIAAGDGLHQFDVGADGSVTPKAPATAPAPEPAHFLALSPDGHSMYASTGPDGLVLQYDVAADGRLSLKTPASVSSGNLGPLAVTPDGRHLYGLERGAAPTVWQYAIDPAAGTLSPLTPASVSPPGGGNALDLAVAPDSGSLYVLDIGASERLAQYAVGADGRLAPRAPATVPVNDQARGLAVTPEADLSAQVAAAPDPAALDGDVTFAVTVTHEHGTPAGAARVTVPLAADLVFRSASTPGGACTNDAPVVCDIAPLAEGESRTVTITARATDPGTHDVTATVEGIAPDPNAANDAGTDQVSVIGGPARATTAPASAVTTDGATLNGVVVPVAQDTSAWFEIGPAPGSATTTTPVDVPDGAGPTLVSTVVGGLEPDTTYHYRLVVTDETGAEVAGQDRTFTTPVVPVDPPPRVEERIVERVVERPVEVIRTVHVPQPVPAPAPPVGGLPPLAPAADRTAPSLSALSLAATRLRVRLSEAATVRATVAVQRTRRVRGKTTRRWVTARRGTVEATKAGLVSLRLEPRLAAGRYRVTLTAADAAGNDARRLTATRTIRRAARR